MSKNQNTNETPNKKATSKQVAAIVAIVLLVLLYVVTLILAFIGNENTEKLVCGVARSYNRQRSERGQRS